MIIDAILDRRGGDPYGVEEMKYMYDEAVLFGFDALARALDTGRNADVQRELCAYVDDGEYDPGIKEYVMSADWIADV